MRDAIACGFYDWSVLAEFDDLRRRGNTFGRVDRKRGRARGGPNDEHGFSRGRTARNAPKVLNCDICSSDLQRHYGVVSVVVEVGVVMVPDRMGAGSLNSAMVGAGSRETNAISNENTARSPLRRSVGVERLFTTSS